MKTISLTLPWPPSVNHYYGRSKSGNVYLKEAGRMYRKNAAVEFARLGWPRIDGFVRVDIIASPPDRRRRDIDNIRKAAYDAISDRKGHTGVIADDVHIQADSAVMAEPGEGVIHISITSLGKERL